MTIKPENINAALDLLEQHELVGAKILVNPQRYQDIQRWRIGAIDATTPSDALKKYMKGSLRQDIK